MKRFMWLWRKKAVCLISFLNFRQKTGMKTKRLLFLLAILFPGLCAHAQTVTWRQVNGPGTWSNTKFLSATNGMLYSIEQSGELYKTDPEAGTWVKIDTTSYANTVHLFAGNKNVFTIENNGSLYKINPVNGEWVQLGETGDWGNTIAGLATYGYLFTIQANGSLYATNTNTGAKLRIGKAEFGNVKHLFEAAGNLYSIEKDGSLYEISEADGRRKKVGTSNAWANSIAGAILAGKLYTIDGDGGLYITELASGRRQKAGAASFGKVSFMVAAKGTLYITEASGSMYEAGIN